MRTFQSVAITLAAVAAMVAALAGCGQKGPLTLPGAKAPQGAASAPPAR